MRIKKIDRFVAGAVIAVALPLGILLPADSGPKQPLHRTMGR